MTGIDTAAINERAKDTAEVAELFLYDGERGHSLPGYEQVWATIRDLRAALARVAELETEIVTLESRIEQHDEMRLAAYASTEMHKARAERDAALARVAELEAENAQWESTASAATDVATTAHAERDALRAAVNRVRDALRMEARSSVRVAAADAILLELDNESPNDFPAVDPAERLAALTPGPGIGGGEPCPCGSCPACGGTCSLHDPEPTCPGVHFAEPDTDTTEDQG